MTPANKQAILNVLLGAKKTALIIANNAPTANERALAGIILELCDIITSLAKEAPDD
jgi:hypothetical protein